MRLSHTLFLTALLLAPIALVGTTWLYFYPYFHSCSFPVAPPQYADNTGRAPFRLLALGDPQLEGDSSLPKPDAPIFPSLEYLLPHLENAADNTARIYMLKAAGRGVFQDLGKWLEGKRKAIDLWGNDWYLAHIVRSTRRWTEPSHVVVLGDLLGSQWITEGEFERRVGRYWGVVMRGLRNVPDRIFGKVDEGKEDKGEEDANDHEGTAAEDVVAGHEEKSAEKAEEELQQDIVDTEPAKNDEHREHRIVEDKVQVEQEVETALAEPIIDHEAREEHAEDQFPQEVQVAEECGHGAIQALMRGNDISPRDTTDTDRLEPIHEEEQKSAGAHIEQGHGTDYLMNEYLPKQREAVAEARSRAEEGQGDVIEEEYTSERSELFDAMKDVDEDKGSEVNHGATEHVEEQGEEDQTQDQLDQTDHIDGDGSLESHQDEPKKPLRKPSWGGTTEVLGEDPDWENRVINIAGNHDVGYAGDLDDYRIERFEKAFGSVNWDIWFELPEHLRKPSGSGGRGTDPAAGGSPPALRLVILNSMNLDTPAWNSELQTETYSFMNHIITSARPVEDKTHATVLLTHIPLEKQAGICVDAPYFNFFDGGHGVREQNMLSDFSTKTILEGIFGMTSNPFAAGSGLGRRGIILNGHDHEGCDTVHFVRQDGVLDHCEPDAIKKDEAYWPTPSSTTTTEPPTPIPTPHHEPTSPSNPLILESTPAFYHKSDPEPENSDTNLNTGWLAQRFPHRTYSIAHDTLSNTTTCTSITESPHIREITLRSMMGEFSGYAGFLSAWFDTSKGDNGEWVVEFRTCGVGIQHWWWGVHIVDLILVVMVLSGGFMSVVENVRGGEGSMRGVDKGWDGVHENGNGNRKVKT